MSKLDNNRLSHFKVSLDSVTVADFIEARGLDLRTEVLEHHEGGVNERTHKIPGQARFTRITLARGTTDSLELFEWIQKAMSGQIERKNGAIMALNQDGEVVSRWEFKDAWPCAYEGPSFGGGRTEVAIERLTIAHRGWELKPGDVKSDSEAGGGGRASDGPVRTDTAGKAPPSAGASESGFP
ncbi:MAG: phage tail protein, partial [Planctomycetes bacterium]|nr:phage tail protein [Planctomycetota bacterium]